MTRKITFKRQSQPPPEREIYWEAVRAHYDNFLTTNAMSYTRLYESDVDSIAIGETLYRKGTLKPYYPVVVEGVEKGNQKMLEKSYILYTPSGVSFVDGKPCKQTKMHIMELFRES